MENTTIKDFYKELQMSDQFFSDVDAFIKSGKNTLLQTQVTESMTIDDAWVNTIITYLHSVEQIVKNPKKSIIDEDLLVNVEKAKKISPNTIRHLAAHTNLIRSIDEKGRIKPSKVMTKEMQEDLLIYENRFVYTLVLKLQAFIEHRYNSIKEQIDTYDTTNLKLKSSFRLDKGDVDYDMDIKIHKPPINKVNVRKNKELLNKIEIIRKRIAVIRSSSFGQILASAKTISPPIMKTNILNMNTDYNNCYKLWIFLSSYATVGYSVAVNEKKLPVDTEYYDDLTMLVATSLKTMVENNALRRSLYDKIPSKKRRIKKYREFNKIAYTPVLRSKNQLKENQMVNQYYYDKLKELVMDKEDIKTWDIIDEKQLHLSFQKFYRGINKLTNEMYQELLKISRLPEPIRKQSTLQKTEFQIKRQQELCKKYQVLNRLKSDELLQSLKKENTQKLKLERLKFKLELLKAKDKKRKTKKENQPINSNQKTANTKYKSTNKRAIVDEKTRLEKQLLRQKKIIENKLACLQNSKSKGNKND